jgi:hypothetical protein
MQLEKGVENARAWHEVAMEGPKLFEMSEILTRHQIKEGQNR